ncbi:hypothetical protein [Mammaliicoccus sciuri]|uniref:hypothetical protein n=1 Tax=Mammaliicoccus sciuri TaxID=1296 RepID=UPI003F543ED5
MPTIKTKKEMNLPELIEWAWKNEIKKRSFISNDGKITANFEDMGRFIADSFISSDVTFTVEVEEPITEDTVFDKLISRYVFLSSKPSYAHAINASIKEVIEDRKVATHIYLENEENELQLIWTKEKGLVE